MSTATKSIPAVAAALTIKQPWAWCILRTRGPRKDVENRSWPTSYRGPLVIHAGGSNSDLYLDSKTFMEECGLKSPEEFPLGAILGVVDLIDCVHSTSPEGRQWAKDSPWAMDPHPETYYFILARPRLLKEPVWYNGKLKLFKITERAVLRKLAPLLGAAPKKPRTKRSAASSRRVVARGPKKVASKR